MKRLAKPTQSIEGAEQNNSTQLYVSQVSFDIIHTGEYSEQQMCEALEKAGYIIIGSDSEDMTSQYRQEDIREIYRIDLLK